MNENERIANADHNEYLRERWQEARSRFSCPDCGGVRGLQSLGKQSIKWMIEVPERYPWPEHWWVREDREMAVTHEVFTRCHACCGGEPDTRGFLEVEDEYVKLWVASLCYCDDCERKRNKIESSDTCWTRSVAAQEKKATEYERWYETFYGEENDVSRTYC